MFLDVYSLCRCGEVVAFLFIIHYSLFTCIFILRGLGPVNDYLFPLAGCSRTTRMAPAIEQSRYKLKTSGLAAGT